MSRVEIWLGGVAAALVCGLAQAQQYPARQVTIVNGFGGASAVEIEVRAMVPFLEKAWGHPVVVDSRPGAAGMIATEMVTRAAPDGYTLLAGSAGLLTYKLLFKDVRFDWMTDLDPVTIYADYRGGFLINTQVPARTIEEFIALAKANPGKYNYASVGRTSSVLVFEILKAATGIQVTHIPHKTSADSQNSLIRNDAQLLATTFDMGLKSRIAGGLPIRPILTVGDTRAPVFPDVPTSSEKGWYIPKNGWYALFAPKGTPKPIIDRIAGDVARYAATPAAQKRAADLGVSIVGSTPAELRQLMERDNKTWTDIAQRIGLKPE